VQIILIVVAKISNVVQKDFYKTIGDFVQAVLLKAFANKFLPANYITFANPE
jgi:hypothetical protein